MNTENMKCMFAPPNAEQSYKSNP